MRIHQDAISSCLDEKSRVIAFDRRNACGRPEKSKAEHCGQIPSFLVLLTAHKQNACRCDGSK